MLTMSRRPRRGNTFESINARFFFLTARGLDEISRCINETRVNTVTFLSRQRRSSQAARGFKDERAKAKSMLVDAQTVSIFDLGALFAHSCNLSK
jgi:hypothetical protein